MMPRHYISFTVVIVLLCIWVLMAQGCQAKVAKPWECECSTAEGKMKCSGMKLNHELEF